MTKRSILPQSRRHIHLYDEDWQYLLALYNGAGNRAIRGPNQAIRELVHNAVIRIRERENQIVTRAKQQAKEPSDDGRDSEE